MVGVVSARKRQGKVVSDYMQELKAFFGEKAFSVLNPRVAGWMGGVE